MGGFFFPSRGDGDGDGDGDEPYNRFEGFSQEFEGFF